MCPRPIFTLLSATLLLVTLLLATGCKENKAALEEEDRYFKTDPETVPEVHQNRLGSEPTAFLRNQASAPVHWQPWAPELFEHALREQKIVFALVVNGNFPATQELLESLAIDPELVRILNTHYVCSLVDVHANPEVGLFAKTLAHELALPIRFPTMIWLTHEKNPIAWLPLSVHEVRNFNRTFSQSHEMLRDRWEAQPRYVVRNSEMDNSTRAEHLATGLPRADKIKLRETIHMAAREISALYDPTSGELDGSGGLVPFGILQFASVVANDGATSPTIRKRLLAMLKGHTDLLLKSAVHDPLDGGFFSARRTRGWSLPVFSKDSATQLECVIALTQVAAATGDENYLMPAQKVLTATEAQFSDKLGGLGLYQYAASEDKTTAAYLWSREKLVELLSPDEFAVAEKSYGITSRGNIPIENDPKRSYFRLNSLRREMAIPELALELGIPAAAVTERLASARNRLLVHRQEMLGEEGTRIEKTHPLSLMARHVAALTELGFATHNQELLKRARVQLDALRKKFVLEGGLMRLAPAEGRRGVPARGNDYAILLDAIFRLYLYDLNPADLTWAHGLAQEALEKLKTEEGLLREAPINDRILLPASHGSSMIFGSSTWGVIYGPLARLNLLTGSEELAAALTEIELRIAQSIPKNVLSHSDFGIGALTRLADTLVCLDGPAEASLEELQGVLKEPANRTLTVVRLDPALPSAFSIPEQSGTVRALLMRGGKLVGEASTAEELRTLLAAPSPND
jgi:uncharacterized protein YyaL (SSP411 family)